MRCAAQVTTTCLVCSSPPDELVGDLGLVFRRIAVLVVLWRIQYKPPSRDP